MVAGGDNRAKSAKMNICPHCFLKYSSNLENLDPSTPKPQNIDVGLSFDSNRTIESPKKALPEQHYFGQGLFLDFQ